MSRDPQVILIVGAKKHGKSTFCAELVWRQPAQNALVYKVGASVLDGAFKKFGHMPMDGSYTGGKVIVNGALIPYRKFLAKAYASFRHGSLVIDDASFHEINNLTDELQVLAGMCRFLDVDIFLVFHGLTSVPIRLFNYVNAVYLFHTTDNPAYKLTKLPEGQMLMEAKARIARQVAAGKRFYYEKIKLS